jgi:hypothetical protein
MSNAKTARAHPSANSIPTNSASRHAICSTSLLPSISCAICIRAVADEYKTLIHEFGRITALAHGEMFEFTERVPAGVGI